MPIKVHIIRDGAVNDADLVEALPLIATEDIGVRKSVLDSYLQRPLLAVMEFGNGQVIETFNYVSIDGEVYLGTHYVGIGGLDFGRIMGGDERRVGLANSILNVRKAADDEDLTSMYDKLVRLGRLPYKPEFHEIVEGGDADALYPPPPVPEVKDVELPPLPDVAAVEESLAKRSKVIRSGLTRKEVEEIAFDQR